MATPIIYIMSRNGLRCGWGACGSVNGSRNCGRAAPVLSAVWQVASLARSIGAPSVSVGRRASRGAVLMAAAVDEQGDGCDVFRVDFKLSAAPVVAEWKRLLRHRRPWRTTRRRTGLRSAGAIRRTGPLRLEEAGVGELDAQEGWGYQLGLPSLLEDHSPMIEGPLHSNLPGKISQPQRLPVAVTTTLRGHRVDPHRTYRPVGCV